MSLKVARIHLLCFTLIFYTSGTARDEIYFEQQFIVTGGIDCRLRSTIYTRISERNILTWIQEVTGNIIHFNCIYIMKYMNVL